MVRRKTPPSRVETVFEINHKTISKKLRKIEAVYHLQTSSRTSIPLSSNVHNPSKLEIGFEKINVLFEHNIRRNAHVLPQRCGHLHPPSNK